MKKSILTLIFLIFCVALLRAQEFTTLIVAMDDGTSTKVLLGSQPKVSFNGTVLEIATNTTVLQFDRTKMRSFRTIYEPSTGVGGVKVAVRQVHPEGRPSDFPESAVGQQCQGFRL
jgi:hypothetical protein